jgi:hypothetical protein
LILVYTTQPNLKERKKKLVEYQQELAKVEERTKDLLEKGTKSRNTKSGTPQNQF